jgi:hypothetical protein
VEPTTVDAAELAKAESFYASVYRRIVRYMIALFLVAAPIAWIRFRWPAALAFTVGCGVGALNFYWLKTTLTAMADRVTKTGQPQSSAGVIFRFLLRYVLIAVAAYGIFRGSAGSVDGLFAGLFLPVGAIFIEAMYVVFAGLLRDSKFQE